MNVFDLPGSAFLEFYLALLLAGILLASIVRWLLRSPGESGQMGVNLDPYETAYLVGGPRMAVDAALAGLVHCQAVAMKEQQIEVQADHARSLDGLARIVCESIANGDAYISSLRARAPELTAPIAERLCSMELAMSPAKAKRVRFLPAAVFVLVFAVGLIKVIIGLSRNRPVLFLVLLLFITGIVALVFVSLPVFSTRAGSRFLASMRKEHAGLRETAVASANRLSYGDLALALALFGPTMLSGENLSPLRLLLFPPKSSGMSSDSSSCGSSCGGGGGGGGGCGGCSGG